jgi:hypothetical protein
VADEISVRKYGEPDILRLAEKHAPEVVYLRLLELEQEKAAAEASNASVTKAWYAARAERDEAHTLNASLNQQVEMAVRMLEAAEAERDEAQETNKVNAEMAVWKHELWKTAEAERDRYKRAFNEAIDRLGICEHREAEAKAEVARLREALALIPHAVSFDAAKAVARAALASGSEGGGG